ncbi:DEAD/DEAH box helicase family protein [Micromonospora sp. NPDC023888]|uniref:DEAD/DEAH box helicase family protein n=1 Tax=Micromonospora sp. NPDC023888 TaxID=3155607 RepID=UPI0033D9D395
MDGFLDPLLLRDGGPHQFVRQIERLLWHQGFTDVTNVDGSGDGGGDILAGYRGRDWVVQCKWKARGAVPAQAVDETAAACDLYRAPRAAVVTNTRFSADAMRRAERLNALGYRIHLWSGGDIAALFKEVPSTLGTLTLREYQREAVQKVLADLDETGRALLILATGLGKTVVGGEVIADHLRHHPSDKVLVVAHTKDLVQQLERAMWRHLPKSVPTRLLTGDERPDHLPGVTCATLGSAVRVSRLGYSPSLVMVDEAHHVAEGGQYDELLRTHHKALQFGVTATPWRGDEYDISARFGKASHTLGIEQGMARGYLAQVDYRLFVDNIDWEVVRTASQHSYSLAELNATLFLPHRDEAVRDELADAWGKVIEPRAIVFCRTVEHAERMADLLRRAPRWSGALAVHAALNKRERLRRLLDFRAGRVPILTAVDILNEGVDVPDVNILCFARVTHSRRIFVQQLGRGLRLREGKDRVLVLDFVSDLRRVAAALRIKRVLAEEVEELGEHVTSIISFTDQAAGNLMEEWIRDAADVETAYDESRLQFPSTESLRE